MSASPVLTSVQDGIGTITLNRPEKLNSLNVALFAELRAHVEAIAGQTEQVALVVVRGAGKCFSAGHDLADIAVGEKPPKPSRQSYLPLLPGGSVRPSARAHCPGGPPGHPENFQLTL